MSQIRSMIGARAGGIFRYTRELVSALLELDRKNRYTLIHYRNLGGDIYGDTSELIVPLNSIPFSHEMRKAIMIPLSVRKERLDIVHEPRAFSPYLFPSYTKKILTVHDVTTMLHPSTHTSLNRFRMNFSISASVKRAERVITVSKFSKREILRLFRVDDDKVEVIPEGVDGRFKHVKECKEVSTKYGIESRFVLFVGRLEPRKNLNGLIRAFYKLKKKGTKHRLVLAGAKGWKCGDE